MTMLLSFRFRGLRRSGRSLERASQRIMPELGRNVAKAGEIVIGEAKKQFKGSRTRARRFKRNVTAPPHKLGVDMGQYRKSITQDVRRKRNQWNSEVGPTVKYARVHELGIGRMPQRQVLTPGVKASEDKVYKILGRTFQVVT